MVTAPPPWVPEWIEQPDVPDGYAGVLEVRIEELDSQVSARTAKLYMRPGLSETDREGLDVWAMQRLERLTEHDMNPDLDGWGEFEQDGARVLQLHARLFEHPDL
jgi:hypothetical protein